MNAYQNKIPVALDGEKRKFQDSGFQYRPGPLEGGSRCKADYGVDDALNLICICPISAFLYCFQGGIFRAYLRQLQV